MERYEPAFEIPPEEWAKHLTPDYRAHFERIGEELVSYDVSNHRYTVPSKHFAALVWLREKREAREARETQVASHVKWTLVAAVGACVIAVLGVVVTYALAP